MQNQFCRINATGEFCFKNQKDTVQYHKEQPIKLKFVKKLYRILLACFGAMNCLNLIYIVLVVFLSTIFTSDL